MRPKKTRNSPRATPSHRTVPTKATPISSGSARRTVQLLRTSVKPRRIRSIRLACTPPRRERQPLGADEPRRRPTARELDHLDGVRKLLLDLEVVGDDEDLAEAGLEAFEGEQHALLAVSVEGAEHLVEDKQADRAARLESHVLADGDPQGQIGEVGLRAGEAVHPVDAPSVV